MLRKTTLAVVLCLLCLPAFAQRFAGDITGTVTDQSGAALPNVTVKVTNDETGASRTTTTGGDGSYRFPQLPLGTYTVTANASGFKETIQKGVTLHVADNRTVDISMQVGTGTEQVTVEAEAMRVETESGEVAGLVTGTEVRELPLNGRNFVQLTQLMPGVSPAENFDSKNKGLLSGVDMSVSGGGITNNLWLVDGANNNDVGSNRTILVYPSVDSIQEFKIHRNSYGAEFGQAAGAQVNIVTRSGQNAFHGSVYYFGRNDAFNATHYALNKNNQPKDILKRHDYGYTLGGPIAKDRVFFFWSQEWNVERRGTVRSALVPTVLQKQGNFSEPRVGTCGFPTPTDPQNGGAAFPGNTIPANRISPGGQLLMSLYPDPNVPIDPVTCVNWIQSVNTPIDWRQESIRGDINITNNTQLMLRYTQDKWLNDAPNANAANGLWGDDNFPGVDSAWNQPGKQAVAKLTQTFGARTVNSIQFSYSGNKIDITRGGTDAALNDQIIAAIPSTYPMSGKVAGDLLPHPVWWGGGGYQALWNMAPWNNNQDIFAWKDDFSRVMGSHTLKAGILYSKNAKNELIGGAGNYESPQFWGAAGVNGWGSTTGNTIADFMLRDMTHGFAENRIQPEAQTRWTDMEIYVGDTWKANRNLTLDFGLRYSYLPEPYDANDALAVFSPAAYNPALGSVPCNGLVFPGSENPCTAAGFAGGTTSGNRSIRDNDLNTFAPRFGFAWDVTGEGKTSLRGGVGQFFQRDRVGPLLGLSGNPPFNANINGIRKLDTAAEPCGGCFATANGLPVAGLDLTARLPNSWQWNLTLEQEVWRDSILEIGYVANRGIHLTSSYAINQVAPANRLAYVQAQGNTGAQAALRPFPELAQNGNIVFFDRSGNSNYHSLQSQFRTRFGRGSQFQFSYTWSRLIEDAILGNANGGISNASFTDLSNRALDRGPSPLHRPHSFNASLVYLTPELRGQNGFVRAVFGDWEVASIAILSHGSALTVYYVGAPLGFSGTGYTDNQRPNRVAGEPCRAGGNNSEQWLNPNAFTLNGFQLGTIGNAGRGSCYGPGITNFDLALYKNFTLTERLKLQFRAEAFNAFNTTQFRTVNANYSPTSVVYDTGQTGGNTAGATRIVSATPAGNFGTVDPARARDPRQIQFALKLTF